MRPSPRLSALVFLLALLAWAKAVGSPFWLDDYVQLERAQAAAADPWALWGGFRFTLADVSPLWLANESWSVFYFRPLVNGIFLLEWWLWGAWAPGYHATNLLLHGSASVLLVFVAARLSRSAWVGFLAGLIFALHPSHQDTVAWISGRTDLVAALPILGAIWFQLRDDERGRAWSPMAAALLVVAFLAKESAAAFAPLVVCLTWYQTHGEAWKPRLVKSLRAAAPALVITLLYVGLRLLGGGFGEPGSAYLTPPTDPGFVPLAIWRYFHYLLNLLFLIPVEPVVVGPALAARPFLVIGLGLVVLLLLFLADRVDRQQRGVRLGLLFWFISLAPAIPIVVGQRFLYLPSVGYSLALAAALATWFADRRLQLALFTLLLLAAAWVKTLFREDLVRVVMVPLQELSALRAEFQSGDRLYFVDLPPLVCMGFGAAMRQILKRDDLQVLALTLSPELPPSAARLLDEEAVGSRTGMRIDAQGRLELRRAGGEYFASYMERFFLWGLALPDEGSLVEAEGLRVEIGPRGPRGGIEVLSFGIEDGLDAAHNWVFVSDADGWHRIRSADLSPHFSTDSVARRRR